MRSFTLILSTLLALATALTSSIATAAPVDTNREIAARVCDVLHVLPAQRRKECCNVSATNLADLCTNELTKALDRKHASINDITIDACAAATNASLKGCDWVGPVQPALPKSCATLINGHAEAGTQCHSSLECGDGLYCRGLSPLAAGVCAPPAQPGGRCELPADHLAAYARSTDDPRHPTCNGLCLRGRCLAQVPEGGQCHASSICAKGLSCVAGQCKAATLPKLGEACSATPGCGEGASCIAGRCALPKAGGESCRLPFECRSMECSIKPGESDGRCAEVCDALSATAQPALLNLH